MFLPVHFLPALCRSPRAGLAAVFFILAPLLVEAGTLRGTVSSAEQPLQGVRLELEGTSYRTTSDRSGFYDFANLPAGSYTLRASYPGYEAIVRTIEVPETGVARRDFTLGEEILELETFQVSATQSDIVAALARERAGQNITDVISADALGRFPDKSVADATRRLAGVTVERSPGEGEGRYVTVRGMNADFNAVAINGVPITVSNFDGASRSVPLDVVPSKNISAIEISKVLRPDQNADSIGGAINIETRDIFDRGERYLFADFAISRSALITDYGDGFYLDPTGWDLGLEYGDFLNADKTLGFVLGVNGRETPYVSQAVDIRAWDTVIDDFDLGVDGAYAPTGVVLQEFFDQIEGSGLNGRLSYRPSEDRSYSAGFTWTRRESRRGRQRQEIRFDRDTFYWDDSAPIVREGDTVTEFTSDNRLVRQVRDFYEEQNLYALYADGLHRLGDLTWTWAASYQRGEFDGDPDRDLWVEFRSGFGFNTYTLDEAYFPEFSTERDRLDPYEFGVNTINLGTRSITDEATRLETDLEIPYTLGEHPALFEAGVQARLRQRDFDNVDRYYDNFTTDGLPEWYLDLAPDGGPPVTADYGPDHSVDDRYEYGFFIDPDRARAVVDQFLSSGALAFNEAGALDSELRSLAGSYQAEENIYATYAQTQVNIEDWTILAGVRLEATEVTFDGYAAQNDFDSFFTDVVPLTESNDYVNLFPSLQLRYNAREDVVVRAAFWTSLARPSYRQLNPSERFDPNDNTVARGDTQLDPTYSYNLDLMVDYYIGKVGVLSAGVFYKDMSDNIYSLRGLPLPDDVVFRAEGATLTEWRNAEGAQVLGLEVSLVRDLSFLPEPFDGLSVFGNYTYIDSEVETGIPQRAGTDLPLFGQVEQEYNLGVEWNRYGIELRVAYSWRDGYLAFNGLSEISPDLDEYLSDLGQLDITASYELPMGFSVFTELVNITDAPDRAYAGNEALRPYYNEYRGWTGYFGVRWEH